MVAGAAVELGIRPPEPMADTFRRGASNAGYYQAQNYRANSNEQISPLHERRVMVQPRTADIDWGALLPDVAQRLLGDPPKKQRSEWRYGRKGSLKVNLPGHPHAGRWTCFESGRSGGVLALIEREVGLSDENKHRAAFAWLREQGFIQGKAPADAQQPAADPDPPPYLSDDAARPPARKKTPKGPPVEPTWIWEASEPAHPDSPAWRYLAGRLAWPPANAIFPKLPASVRWLSFSGKQTPRYFRRVKQLDPAAGLVVFAFRRWVEGESGPVVAVSLEAVRDDGALHDPRWRRTYGSRANALFDAGGKSNGRLILVEGEVSALAARWLYPGHRAMATGGSSGLSKLSTNILPGRVTSLTIDADGDSAGERSGFVALYSVIRACPGVRVKGVARSGGEDAADELADWIGERLALMSEGSPIDVAPIEAWKSVFAHRGITHDD